MAKFTTKEWRLKNIETYSGTEQIFTDYAVKKLAKPMKMKNLAILLKKNKKIKKLY